MTTDPRARSEKRHRVAATTAPAPVANVAIVRPRSSRTRAACLATGAIVAIVASSACAPESAPPTPDPTSPEIPGTLERIELSNLAGDAVAPVHDAPGAAAVLVFVRRDCPISNRYAPEIAAIHADYDARGVGVWMVYPDPEDEPRTIRAHLEEYGYPQRAVLDPEHRLVAAVGATITPEVAVALPDGRLVYRGRIDDRYVAFGQARPRATRHDVREVLDAVLAGEIPAARATEAVGCAIEGLR